MEDYNKLYDKETFQSSIFVDDEKYIYDTEKTINDMGYTTLVVKDTLTNDAATLMSVLKIVRVVVIVVEFIFLFFISYFVIKLIQKSKNVYYATVRILGGSKKVINSLINKGYKFDCIYGTAVTKAGYKFDGWIDQTGNIYFNYISLYFAEHLSSSQFVDVQYRTIQRADHLYTKTLKNLYEIVTQTIPTIQLRPNKEATKRSSPSIPNDDY